MGDKTGISWTDATWSPTRGCRRISAGCENCYAERQAMRMSGTGGAYEGLVKLTSGGPRWTGDGRLVPSMLDQPLRWTKPRRIFVDSMSDLFYEAFSFEDIAAVFGVMAACPQHVFQVLTKRPERARAWFEWVATQRTGGGYEMDPVDLCGDESAGRGAFRKCSDGHADLTQKWPLPNVWLGCSVENQRAADDRILELLRCPAALHWVSVEPQLEPVDLRAYLPNTALGGIAVGLPYALGWVVQGGESGPKARPFDPTWADDMREQCANAGVPYFMKQMGAVVIAHQETFGPGEAAERTWPNGTVFRNRTGDAKWNGRQVLLKSRAGADPAEWPDRYRVQEWPR